jgi:polysaccharide biosynthesis/export protein
MPASGPNAKTISESVQTGPDAGLMQLIDIDDRVVAQLLQRQRPFSETFGSQPPFTPVIGQGDTVEVTLWEAPPATLFSASSLDAHVTNASGAVPLPPQMVDREGMIDVPFVGRVLAGGRTPGAVGNEIAQRLKNKANQPQVLVRVAQNASATVAVVGEVATNMRMPLTAGGERLLDALATAGGVRQPVGKITVQITRGNELHAMPLDQVIRDPRQNVALRPGDVVTALFQPHSFTALGATGRQSEVPFEAQGITLVQALARSGGVQDLRADPQGVFIFRFEPRSALAWPSEPVATVAGDLVPVIYRLNLRDPKSFFTMQSFPMRDRDILYVSNAPLAELQKFINLVFSINRQVIGTVQSVD